MITILIVALLALGLGVTIGGLIMSSYTDDVQINDDAVIFIVKDQKEKEA